MIDKIVIGGLLGAGLSWAGYKLYQKYNCETRAFRYRAFRQARRQQRFDRKTRADAFRIVWCWAHEREYEDLIIEKPISSAELVSVFLEAHQVELK